jgi:hypothetical protein
MFIVPSSTAAPGKEASRVLRLEGNPAYSTLLALLQSSSFAHNRPIFGSLYMRKRIILPLGAAFCLSFASPAGGQEKATAVPRDKAALLAAEQARVELQHQVNSEKSRIIDRLGGFPKDQRKKTLLNQVKNSLILQQAHNNEGGQNRAQGLRKASPDTAASTSKVIAHINSLPVAERKFALREAMKALKGKKLEK